MHKIRKVVAVAAAGIALAAAPASAAPQRPCFCAASVAPAAADTAPAVYYHN